MPWSTRILTQFATVSSNPLTNEYQGPYNKLLNYLFPVNTDFTIVPQWWESNLPSATNLVVIWAFEVWLRKKPVFILVLNRPADLDFISSRRGADERIRERMGDLRVRCPIPTLYAVSAMGTRLCFYEVSSGNDTAMILPLGIEYHPEFVNDSAPADRWDCDVLEEEGEARLHAVVNEIQQACTAIV